jgi:cation transport ATPase
MKILLIPMLVLFSSSFSFAASDRVMTIRTSVHGMVCSFCAQGILAHFKKHEAVSNIRVDLTREVVLIEEKKGHSLSDDEINSFIKKSGFNPVKIERISTAFSES